MKILATKHGTSVPWLHLILDIKGPRTSQCRATSVANFGVMMLSPDSLVSLDDHDSRSEQT